MRKYALIGLWTLALIAIVLLALSGLRIGFTGQSAEDGLLLYVGGLGFTRDPSASASLNIVSGNFKRDRTPIILHKVEIFAEDGQLVKRRVVNQRLINLSGLIDIDYARRFLGLDGEQEGRDLRANFFQSSTMSTGKGIRILMTSVQWDFNLKDISPTVRVGDDVKFKVVATYFNLLTRIEKTQKTMIEFHRPLPGQVLP